ncbi:hypothetical protein DPMN_035430 [Dreissena polymorpha]|uniref:Uncharacterized protein n=1 Tax=Dreissena polymorpha TaxID=45954 RepID=A0A9D4M9J3_DREPO|nr:hypothetical protein DPMN_035430 [Dreissena polymorpha]
MIRAPEHLPGDGQQVPHALWLPASQGSQQALPFSCSRWGRLGQEVHITANESPGSFRE